MARDRRLTSVQVDLVGTPVEVTTEDKVMTVIILEVHNKHYVMANGAPISQVPLSQEFGHMSKGLAADLVLAGTYDFTGEDRAMADILWEITWTRFQV